MTYVLVDAATARQIDALTLEGGRGRRVSHPGCAGQLGRRRSPADAGCRGALRSERRATQSTDAYAFALQGRG